MDVKLKRRVRFAALMLSVLFVMAQVPPIPVAYSASESPSSCDVGIEWYECGEKDDNCVIICLFIFALEEAACYVTGDILDPICQAHALAGLYTCIDACPPKECPDCEDFCYRATRWCVNECWADLSDPEPWICEQSCYDEEELCLCSNCGIC